MSHRAKVIEKTSIAKKENSVSHIRKTNYAQSINLPIDHILFLQRAIGNQAVQKLIKSEALQSKLKIGKLGDKYEQEADRVADAVMRMPEPQTVSSGTPYISIQMLSQGGILRLGVGM